MGGDDQAVGEAQQSGAALTLTDLALTLQCDKCAILSTRSRLRHCRSVLYTFLFGWGWARADCICESALQTDDKSLLWN